MARTVVAAATFATEGKDAVILATAGRLVPSKMDDIRGEVTLAKARRSMKSTATAKGGTITIPGNTAVVTESTVFTKTVESTVTVPKLDSNGNQVKDSNGNPVTEQKVVKVEVPYTPTAPVSVSGYAAADPNRP
jgi:predicted peptidase